MQPTPDGPPSQTHLPTRPTLLLLTKTHSRTLTKPDNRKYSRQGDAKMRPHDDAKTKRKHTKRQKERQADGIHHGQIAVPCTPTTKQTNYDNYEKTQQLQQQSVTHHGLKLKKQQRLSPEPKPWQRRQRTKQKRHLHKRQSEPKPSTLKQNKLPECRKKRPNCQPRSPQPTLQLQQMQQLQAKTPRPPTQPQHQPLKTTTHGHNQYVHACQTRNTTPEGRKATLSTGRFGMYHNQATRLDQTRPLRLNKKLPRHKNRNMQRPTNSTTHHNVPTPATTPRKQYRL